MKASIKEGRALLQDIINYKADGTPFLNRLLLLPLKYEGKLYYIGLQNDLTHLFGLEPKSAKLRRVHEGEIKHIINNCLTVILGCANILERKKLSPKRRQEITQKIEDEFYKIHNYCLEVEEQSEFESFSHLESLKVSNG